MADDLSANLAENLRRLREARGLTQQDLSSVSGVPRPTVAHLESGAANPTLGVLVRVATALGVVIEDLVAARRRLLTLHPKTSLIEQEGRGQSRREVCPNAPSGILVERIELSLRGSLERTDARPTDRTYLACERGDVDVLCGSERLTLKTGDVAEVARGAGHACQNKGRGAAILYSVRIGALAS
jgi:transcriptional regulator with XRE-family HTH domain